MKRYESEVETLTRGVRQLVVMADGRPLTMAEAFDGWAADEAFRDHFLSILTGAAAEAYFWEMPPVVAGRLDRRFEFVLVDGPSLARMPVDRAAFGEHFARAGGRDVVSFSNLGGDAHLVVPCPVEGAGDYPHLAAFVRSAPASQQHGFWQAVAAAVHERLSQRPLWISTAGMGVAWLHVRLDDRPKYYRHRPFAAAAD